MSEGRGQKSILGIQMQTIFKKKKSVKEVSGPL